MTYHFLFRLIPTGRVRWMGHSLVVLLVVLNDTKDRLSIIVTIDGEIICKVLLWMNLTGGRGVGRPPILNIFRIKNNGRRCDDRPTTRKRRKVFLIFFFYFFSCRMIHIETLPPPPPLSLYPKRSLQPQHTCNEALLSLGGFF